MIVKPILLTYATRSGTTAEVATEIARTLESVGHDVEVRPIGEVAGDVSRYGAVVVGSAIRAGKWMPEALGFLDANRAALAAVPVAGFVVCGFGRDAATSAEKAALVASYVTPLRGHLPGVVPVAEASFAGAIDPARLAFAVKLALKLMRAPAGDWRDWPAIRTWAGDLGARLAAAESSA